jgi:hypothetical protein
MQTDSIQITIETNLPECRTDKAWKHVQVEPLIPLKTCWKCEQVFAAIVFRKLRMCPNCVALQAQYKRSICDTDEPLPPPLELKRQTCNK